MRPLRVLDSEEFGVFGELLPHADYPEVDGRIESLKEFLREVLEAAENNPSSLLGVQLCALVRGEDNSVSVKIENVGNNVTLTYFWHSVYSKHGEVIKDTIDRVKDVINTWRK